METAWITAKRHVQERRRNLGFYFSSFESSDLSLIFDQVKFWTIVRATTKTSVSYANVLQSIAIFDQTFEKHRETKTNLNSMRTRDVYSRTRKVYLKSEAESAKTIRMTSRSRLKLEKPFSNKRKAYTQAKMVVILQTALENILWTNAWFFSRTWAISVTAKANEICS